MPQMRLTMRKIREILRLKFELGLDNRQIARSCAIPHSTVANYLSRARASGLAWPLPVEISDGSLDAQLFPAVPVRQEAPLPGFVSIGTWIRTGVAGACSLFHLCVRFGFGPNEKALVQPRKRFRRV